MWVTHSCSITDVLVTANLWPEGFNWPTIYGSVQVFPGYNLVSMSVFLNLYLSWELHFVALYRVVINVIATKFFCRNCVIRWPIYTIFRDTVSSKFSLKVAPHLKRFSKYRCETLIWSLEILQAKIAINDPCYMISGVLNDEFVAGFLGSVPAYLPRSTAYASAETKERTNSKKMWPSYFFEFVRFYPRDAMLARVFATATCLSVRPSVTRRYCA